MFGESFIFAGTPGADIEWSIRPLRFGEDTRVGQEALDRLAELDHSSSEAVFRSVGSKFNPKLALEKLAIVFRFLEPSHPTSRRKWPRQIDVNDELKYYLLGTMAQGKYKSWCYGEEQRLKAYEKGVKDTEKHRTRLHSVHGAALVQFRSPEELGQLYTVVTRGWVLE